MTVAIQHTRTHPSTTPPCNVLQAREAREGTRVGPYHIPKGSTVVFNVFGVHRDPRHYPHPEEFRRVEVGRMGACGAGVWGKGCCCEFTGFSRREHSGIHI